MVCDRCKITVHALLEHFLWGRKKYINGFNIPENQLKIIKIEPSNLIAQYKCFLTEHVEKVVFLCLVW